MAGVSLGQRDGVGPKPEAGVSAGEELFYLKTLLFVCPWLTPGPATELGYKEGQEIVVERVYPGQKRGFHAWVAHFLTSPKCPMIQTLADYLASFS